MTNEELNLQIKEIIIFQEKPRRSNNSYFRKIEEKRRLKKFIAPKKLKNIVSDFYSQFIHLRFPGQEWYRTKYDFMYIHGVGNFGVVYNGLTGRIKISLECEPRKDVRNKRLIKKIQRRQPRKCKAEIANGGAYKKIKMKCPVIG